MAVDGRMKSARQAIEDPFRAAADVGRAVAAFVAAQAGDLQ